MGCFDTVSIKCPCGGSAEFKSKAGDCNLSTFSERDIPPTIAADVQDKCAYCDSCGAMCELNIQIIVITSPKWFP